MLLQNTHVVPTEKTIHVNERGELVTKETTKPSLKIGTITKWTDAFLIYVSIYYGVHLDSVQGLFKYIHDIRLGASRVAGLGFLTLIICKDQNLLEMGCLIFS